MKVLLFVLMLASSAVGQNGWTRVPSQVSPPAGYTSRARMVYDSIRGVTVLVTFDATWEFDGARWQVIVTPTPAPFKFRSAIAFDSNRGVVVMHGGADPFSFFSETWEYDGTDWILTSTAGPYTEGAEMAYDSSAGKMILYGGLWPDGAGPKHDTWEYDGASSSWTMTQGEFSVPNPFVIRLMALVYDPALDRTILFGGQINVAFSLSSKTWAYNEATNSWTQLLPTTSPSPRRGMGFAYDSSRSKVLIHGGGAGFFNGAPLGETWTYDSTANSWTEDVGANGPVSELCILAYDSLRETAVMFGGYSGNPSVFTDETWEYDFNGPVELCHGDGGDQMGCTDCPCGNNAAAGSLGGCLNQSGIGSRIFAAGSLSVSAADPTDLRIGMSGGNPNGFAVLMSGDGVAPLDPLNACFGQDSGMAGGGMLSGLRCAVGNTRRHGGRTANASGTIGLTNSGWGGADDPPAGIAAQAGFVSGQTRYFQATLRDLPLATCTTTLNTSQAIEITFFP